MRVCLTKAKKFNITNNEAIQLMLKALFFGIASKISCPEKANKTSYVLIKKDYLLCHSWYREIYKKKILWYSPTLYRCRILGWKTLDSRTLQHPNNYSLNYLQFSPRTHTKIYIHYNSHTQHSAQANLISKLWKWCNLSSWRSSAKFHLNSKMLHSDQQIQANQNPKISHANIHHILPTVWFNLKYIY